MKNVQKNRNIRLMANDIINKEFSAGTKLQAKNI